MLGIVDLRLLQAAKIEQQIYEVPLYDYAWLVLLGGQITVNSYVSRPENGFGMTGSESNPASLFRLYVDYGRYVEATNVLLEYIESLAVLRPADVIRRKRQCAVWFPYTTIERLWWQLEESIRLGHMVDQSEKLKKLLHGALLKHLNIVKVDSDDVKSSTV